MVESTVIILDNSEWMRNGDYSPTRMLAQQDAADTLCYAKSEQHPENTLAILSSAGNSPEVHIPLTNKQDGLLSAIRSVKIGGHSDLETSIRVAQLVLRNRQNKRGSQRIVIFVGSPVKADQRQFVRLAKQLKKSGVACDIVSIGEIESNQEVLNEFVKAVDKKNNSHLVAVPASSCLLSDSLISTPIIMGAKSEDSGSTSMVTTAPAAVGGGGMDDDPMLAEAIRASLMTHAQESTTKPATPSSNDASQPEPAVDVDDEEALLQAALAMSMAATTNEAKDDNTGAPAPANNEGNDTADMDVDEDEALRLALEMSVNTNEDQKTTEKKTEASASSDAPKPAEGEDDDVAAIMADPEFLQSLVGGLPGVDMNDARILDVLNQVTQGEESEDKEKSDQDDAKPMDESK